MTHIDTIKQLIQDQGWIIKDSFKLGNGYKAVIEKDGVDKLVNLSLSNDEEFEYFNGGAK